MENWHFWVPTGISLLALACSAASWWHNWSAHSERRFGDIVKLRSAVLQRLTTVEERFQEIDRGLGEVRFELPRLSDSVPRKYEWIEGRLALDKENDDFIDKARALRYSLNRLRTEEYSSRILKALQLAEHELGVMEHGADKISEVVDEQFETVQTARTAEREERDRQFAELERLAQGEANKRLRPPQGTSSGDA
ncbi:MAG TPA: hypothetical protein VK794_04790 [Steroidobacteraceae bacterium]|jgi:hypothetical protein|nr:hypothetical protein [Steroidobacteraceae bacterium]